VLLPAAALVAVACVDYRTIVLGPREPSAADYRLSGPYTHENLTVFLIHGTEAMPGRTFLTLQEAMETGAVVVHETKSVNEPAIENVSTAHEVFVQSGDIIKGGEQDRVIAADMILPGNSGRIPIGAFCVEAGRWSRRGGESAATFGTSMNAIAGKDVKLNVQRSMSQSGVWDTVAKNQDKIAANAGAYGAVRSAESPSSFQLTLEAPAVKKATEAYLKALAGIAHGKGDVIGYAFALNGKVNSADVYANTALFGKLWPKLLEACAIEALAELEKGRTYPAVTAEMVRACLTDAESGSDTAVVTAVNGRAGRAEYNALLSNSASSSFDNRDEAILRAREQRNDPRAKSSPDRVRQLESKRSSANAEEISLVLQRIESGDGDGRSPQPVSPNAGSTSPRDARVRVVTRETSKNVLFESRDAKQNNVVLHKRYVAY
jgi:hypothetical protein